MKNIKTKAKFTVLIKPIIVYKNTKITLLYMTSVWRGRIIFSDIMH